MLLSKIELENTNCFIETKSFFNFDYNNRIKKTFTFIWFKKENMIQGKDYGRNNLLILKWDENGYSVKVPFGGIFKDLEFNLDNFHYLIETWENSYGKTLMKEEEPELEDPDDLKEHINELENQIKRQKMDIKYLKDELEENKIIKGNKIIDKAKLAYKQFIDGKIDLTVNIQQSGPDSIIDFSFEDYSELKITIIVEPDGQSLFIKNYQMIENDNKNYVYDCEQTIEVNTEIMYKNYDFINDLLKVLVDRNIDYIMENNNYTIIRKG